MTTVPMPIDGTSRYGVVAIILHWLIAAGVLLLIGMGLAMDHASLDPMRMFQLYQLHKSIGISVLLLVCLRVGWRLTHAAPALPAGMPVAERRAAHLAHLALYGLQIVLPLSGWAMVSASVLGIPTVLFGMVPWPDLPVLATLQDKAPVEAALKGFHHWAAWTLAALIVLHVAAVLRHALILRDSVPGRMLPWAVGSSQRKQPEDFHNAIH
ncbi:cytochrome B561 [Ameyamaea chiangmaiensis NBRC 103196]|uniref:Cytochrome b n=1 Tax=Ameyamaea chiangmaiensis TaxID=442969 RepID=A0A850P6Q0_9PROT|nr:cytochrome b [Ameyamaea chiangmaiensis]MBS4076157.1 cytochrome b [Ameyamaea chiangmaiensis]NVN39544.1 cytochrome b [Ameyamaea chiangmaiensis]GBQ64394.1 cytochrome B561 [Ameyamaea chiangmaiensis NBRC 103196]